MVANHPLGLGQVALGPWLDVRTLMTEPLVLALIDRYVTRWHLRSMGMLSTKQETELSDEMTQLAIVIRRVTGGHLGDLPELVSRIDPRSPWDLPSSPSGVTDEGANTMTRAVLASATLDPLGPDDALDLLITWADDQARRTADHALADLVRSANEQLDAERGFAVLLHRRLSGTPAGW
jgi:hypothetical protein